jgi:hypothetical protein
MNHTYIPLAFPVHADLQDNPDLESFFKIECFPQLLQHPQTIVLMKKISFLS